MIGPADLFRLRLMLVTDGRGRQDLADVAASALKGGARVIQLREKAMDDGALLALARRLRALTHEYGAWLMINERIEVAVAAQADGVHLGWESVSVPHARGRLGEEGIVAVSTHSLAEVKKAAAEGADFAVFGPIFETSSKRGLVTPQGVERLAKCVRAVSIPIVAIGGIGPEHAAAIRGAGAAGMAAMRGLMDASEPERAAAEYLRMWG